MNTRLSKEIGAVKQDLEATKATLDGTTAEVKQLKKEVSDFKKSANDSISSFGTRATNLDSEVKKLKTVSENNLKYLINLDRNDRRKNVILFGVPEINNELTIGNTVASSDTEKCDLILRYIGAPIIEKVVEIFRLGKPVDNKVRPMKLKLSSSEDATTILSAKGKLNNLEGVTIYLKPDKTKAEVAEFQRLGKRKQELLQQYAVEEGTPPRVVLDKGVLKLDGVKVDEYKSEQSLF